MSQPHERNSREDDQELELTTDERDDILRYSVRTLLSVNRDILTEEDFPKLRLLLGGPLQHPTSMGKAQLWFQIVKDLSMGRAYAKELQDEILGIDSTSVDPSKFGANETAIQYYLNVGWANYLYFAQGDYETAAKYAAAGSIIAYQQNGRKRLSLGLSLWMLPHRCQSNPGSSSDLQLPRSLARTYRYPLRALGEPWERSRVLYDGRKAPRSRAPLSEGCWHPPKARHL